MSKSLLDRPEVSPELRSRIEEGMPDWKDAVRPGPNVRSGDDYDRFVEAQMLGEFMSGLGAEQDLMQQSPEGPGGGPSFLETCMRKQLEILADGYHHPSSLHGLTLSIRNGSFADDTEYIQRQAVMAELTGAAKLTPEFKVVLNEPYMGYISYDETMERAKARIEERYKDFGIQPKLEDDNDLAHYNLCIQDVQIALHAPCEGREEYFDAPLPVPEKIFSISVDELLAKSEVKAPKSERRLPNVTLPEQEQSFEDYLGLG